MFLALLAALTLVTQTPYDDRWASVQAPIHSEFARGLRALPEEQRLMIVENYVDSQIRYTADPVDQDQWQPAARTLARGLGDCEDYAIAKLQLLKEAGIAEERLFFTTLWTPLGGHAVLLVQLNSGLYLLDNIDDPVIQRFYRPIYAFSAGKKYRF